MNTIRVMVTVTGRVQGVSYRKHARQMAAELRLTGWIRNCADGSVTGCFEGKTRDIRAMLAWCQSGPPRAAVHALVSERVRLTAAFTDFRIIGAAEDFHPGGDCGCHASAADVPQRSSL